MLKLIWDSMQMAEKCDKQNPNEIPIAIENSGIQIAIQIEISNLTKLNAIECH